MKAYKHILLATNLAEENNYVAERALNISRRAKAKLSIVHIIEFSPTMYGGGEFAVPLSGDIESSVQGQAERALTKMAERLKIAAEDQYLESGDTAEMLVTLANKINADLLIIGSHEHHGLGFLLGSMANTMLRAMPCDVLAVRI